MTDKPAMRSADEIINADDFVKEIISDDEAMQCALRMINSHFNNQGEHMRASIPANPQRDDDLRLCAYIQQRKIAGITASQCAVPQAVDMTVMGEWIDKERLERLLNELADYYGPRVKKVDWMEYEVLRRLIRAAPKPPEVKS